MSESTPRLVTLESKMGGVAAMDAMIQTFEEESPYLMMSAAEVLSVLHAGRSLLLDLIAEQEKEDA